MRQPKIFIAELTRYRCLGRRQSRAESPAYFSCIVDHSAKIENAEYLALLARFYIYISNEASIGLDHECLTKLKRLSRKIIALCRDFNHLDVLIDLAGRIFAGIFVPH